MGPEIVKVKEEFSCDLKLIKYGLEFSLYIDQCKESNYLLTAPLLSLGTEDSLDGLVKLAEKYVVGLGLEWGS